MVQWPVHEEYADFVRAEREVLSRLTERARHTTDPAGLRALAEEIRLRMERGEHHAIGNLRRYLDDVVAELDEIYDAAFPVDATAGLAELLSGPWPTPHRHGLLATLLGRDPRHRMHLDQLVPDISDPALLRLLVLSPLGHLSRSPTVRVLDALHEAGELDRSVVDRAIADDLHLDRAVAGPPRAACADTVLDRVDALVWELVSAPEPPDWDDLPKGIPPRGLRFVRAALDWTGDPRIAAHLGAAELTADELVTLVALLAERPVDDRRRVWGWRKDEQLLSLFGLASAAPLLRLILATPDHEAVRHDRAVLLAAIGEAGVDDARRLLELQPSEMVSAVLGDNRAAVLKRVKHNALQGIAAFGMLPLAPDETVLDRYLALRASAKKGVKLGPNRRHSHAAAIAIALDHLAQVAGVPEPALLEWDCEAALASRAPSGVDCGEYRVDLRFDGAEPVLTVSRAGKPLRSVPATVRADPGYQELREHQELLRDQARRMRTGLVERLVATGRTLQPDELARLRTLPAGAAMLPSLLWRDATGAVGLLDDIDTTGPVTVVHPVDLLADGTLATWQAEIMRRRLQQPVKQAFREVYALTPAERESGDVSWRFAGQTVEGRVAAQLLSGRGWSVGGRYADHQATRPAGQLTAALTAEFHGYFGMGDVLVDGVRFLADGKPVPLDEVPAVVFSEVMRDLDLVVSVAGTVPWDSAPQAASRAQILTTLIAALALSRVTVDGSSAVVRGGRATYRVHLTSGSIHVEPGGYLCVVPARFGVTAHRRLFLPFADEDRMTSVILSKILLLAEDEKITDPSILAQLGALGVSVPADEGGADD
ncbi:hypothetical protein GCM10010112_86260 [Actinoplanes lobatus]|uniref:DUF4132 domain-containing protein n=1 Tax=Actinoplanes lobatus TaxID=113568 RepID=A0A7W7MIP4_9ACTN|nr:DUF4132 domain-containing protein [Actinoplanes lobatus]MBB4751185.1 hypothetical protein [Actinoplanes lobatus]GGN95706.1 hypothetical protein GCM10010112_86260 [Actinoplanes lobatus]GIE44280.1 hypothetical protein Alo02nite_71780 [Actinoplanes lobatus]